VPSKGSFSPFFAKSIRLIDGGNEYGVYGYAHQIKEKATDQHIDQKK
jgi:hypothetical protein